jgi:hypothetical protein
MLPDFGGRGQSVVVVTLRGFRPSLVGPVAQCGRRRRVDAAVLALARDAAAAAAVIVAVGNVAVHCSHCDE